MSWSRDIIRNLTPAYAYSLFARGGGCVCPLDCVSRRKLPWGVHLKSLNHREGSFYGLPPTPHPPAFSRLAPFGSYFNSLSESLGRASWTPGGVKNPGRWEVDRGLSHTPVRGLLGFIEL